MPTATEQAIPLADLPTHAQSLIDEGQAQQAESILRDALERHPDNSQLKRMIGRALMHQGRMAEAVGLLVEATEGAPTDAVCCIDLGQAVHRLGWHEQAALAARRAIELDATSADAFLLLGDALEAQGQSADAFVAVRRAFDILRNKLDAEPEDAAKDETYRPLLLDGSDALFMNWSAEGDRHSYSLLGKSADSKHCVKVHVATEAPTAAQGRVAYADLHAALPQALAAQLELFAAPDYPYTLS